MKKVSIREKAIIIGLMIILSIPIITINYSSDTNNLKEDIQAPNDERLPEKTVNNNGLSPDNEWTGIGSPWNITHFANHTQHDSLTFSNSSYGLTNIQLGYGWEGYQLNASISDLTDTRQWINGTFHFGNDDGDYSSGQDDSGDPNVRDWDFWTIGGSNNPMSGNYRDSTAPYAEGQDCLELRMDGRLSGIRYQYEAADECGWIYTTTIPRGYVKDATFSFDLKPIQFCRSNYWGIRVEINDEVIYRWGTLELYDLGLNRWSKITLPQAIWENSSIFEDPLHSTTIKIELILECTAGGNYEYGKEDGWGVSYQQALIDNIELEIVADAKPSQVGLILNKTANAQDLSYGNGTVKMEGDWDGNYISKILANFSCNGLSNYSEYIVDFNVDFNLFIYKSNQPTLYEKKATSEGMSFLANNASKIEWKGYSYISEPTTAHKEFLMLIEFPEDINITWLSTAQQPSINRLSDICDNSTEGLLRIRVSEIIGIENANGFWEIHARSKNYIDNLSIYNKTASSWNECNVFYAGNSINVSASIKNTAVVSSYLTQTRAKLLLRFPNGSIWISEIQYKNPKAS